MREIAFVMDDHLQPGGKTTHGATAGQGRRRLNSLDGIAYVTDEQGMLVAVGEPSWSAFAEANAGPELGQAPPIGRSLFAMISGDDVRSVYRRIHGQLIAGGAPSVSFEYRCDGPSVRRTMRMTVRKLPPARSSPLILYHSQVVEAVERPWLSLFDSRRSIEGKAADRSYPSVRVCSFCHAVGTAGPWISLEEYCRRGGAADARVSHSLCETCAERL